jgi:hypothetical protein
LLSCTEDDPFRICHSVKEGNGLEAMRLLHRRYEPRTPGTKRALLKAIINHQQQPIQKAGGHREEHDARRGAHEEIRNHERGSFA